MAEDLDHRCGLASLLDWCGVVSTRCLTMVEELLLQSLLCKGSLVLVGLYLCNFMGLLEGKETIQFLEGLRDLGVRCGPLLDFIPLSRSPTGKLFVITFRSY